MSLTFIQKTQLFLIKSLIGLIGFVDYLGNLPEKVLANSLRVGLYLLLVVSLFTNVLVKAENPGIYNISGLFGPNLDSSSVLGISVLRQKLRPVFIKKLPFPNISAKSVLAVDLATEQILLDINGEKALPPASTTKLMTALVALDLYSLDEILVVSEFCTEIESQKAGFYSGEEVNVKDLLYSLLISSSGDAACTLATGKVSYEEFIALMNKKVIELNLQNSYFANPIGLDSDNGNHISTAYDLYLISKEAMKSDLIKEIVKTKELNLLSLSNKITRLIRNTNVLLWDLPGSVGIKTGRTYGAGEVLIYEYNDESRGVLIIVMGSADRFTDTKNILDWILNSYSWNG